MREFICSLIVGAIFALAIVFLIPRAEAACILPGTRTGTSSDRAIRFTCSRSRTRARRRATSQRTVLATSWITSFLSARAGLTARGTCSGRPSPRPRKGPLRAGTMQRSR